VKLIRERRIDVNVDAAPQMLEYRAIAERIAGDAPGTALDWGCGWGQITHLLRELGVDATAYDYAPDAPEEGFVPMQRYPDLQVYLGQDPVKLPFDDHSFGAVLSCGVLEHVASPHGSIEEIKRVLAPRGTFYVYKLPNRSSYAEWIVRKLGLYYHGAHPDDTIYTLESAARLLRQHGFNVVEARRTNMLPLTVTNRLATAAAPAIWTANKALSRIPGLNRIATNIDVIARAPA
jgi:ubiquinone/menaquinone biosynthesis C-methylase UbiE